MADSTIRSDKELSELVHEEEIDACAIDGNSSSNSGLKIDVAGVAGLNLSWTGHTNKTLIAKSGCRIELKEYDFPPQVQHIQRLIWLSSSPKFFVDHILSEHGQCLKVLRTWLSAPTSKALMSKYGLLYPKIWLLTGIYRLENVHVCEVSSKEPVASVNISAEAVAALTGIPVGGSVNLGHSARLKVSVKWPNTLVWAAQYQRVRARYHDGNDSSPEQVLPNRLTMSLYPDIFSKGQLRNTGTAGPTAEIGLGNFWNEDDVVDTRENAGTMEYMQELEQSLEDFGYYLSPELETE